MKKIIVILVMICTMFSLSGCKTELVEPNGRETTVYLKWHDGEEELHPINISTMYNSVIVLTLEDGSKITTGYDNVIIIEK